MKLTNKHGLPEPVVRALTRNEYSKGESNRSITQLIDSPRVRILKQEHWDDLTEDVSEKLWAVLGTAAHKMFEENVTEGHLAEERVFVDIEGWTISGAVDVQALGDDGVTIYDYKTTSVWSVIYGKPEWELQLNCYASLIRRAKGHKVKALKIIAIMRDWNRRDAEEKRDYPNAPIVEVDVPLWTESKQDEYLDGRVKIHQQAEFKRLTGDELPECSASERWEKPSKWAIMKKGLKRAVRVYDSQEEAIVNLEQGQLIEFRPGESTRCNGDWCRVNQWCDQYKKMNQIT
jgi:hypothetical protein